MKKLFLLFLCISFTLMGNAQNFTVTGKVVDESGNTLPGVNVLVKETGKGVITGLDGDYSIQIDKSPATLQFTFIGFEKKELQVTKGQVLNVTLTESLTGLDEIVVTGYGSQNKASVVGAIATISSADIVQSPVSNLSVGLAGKMPGLTIMLKDGELGKERLQTLIRGQATMNNSEPLILVDGVERSINNIDPFDIENISVLKDASATAVFGVRGANGVILVTTKKGLVGPAKVSATMNYSMQTVTRLPKPLNAFDYMTVRNEVVALDNPNNPPAFDESVFEHYRNGDLPEYYVDRDWYGEFFNKYTPMAKANVNIRGGSESTTYFVSLGYISQGGPFKTERWDEYNYDNQQRLDRFTYRANIDMQINKTLKAWMNLSGSLQDKNDPIIYGGSAAAATTASYYYLQLAAYTDRPAISHTDLTPDGEVVSVAGGDRTPYGNLNRTGYRVTTDNEINSTIGFEQDLSVITKGLSARAIVSYDAQALHIRGFRRTYQTYEAQLTQTAGGQDTVIYTPGAGSDSELSQVLTQGFDTRFDLEASLNYKNTFGKNNVTGLLLYKQNKRVLNNNIPNRYVGIVGRAIYNYAQRYLAEFNFGMNGSEQFAAGRRFGFFPSLSVGWVLSEEQFLKSSKAIEFLKIRGSFGQVGNDKTNAPPFLYLADWTQGNGDYFNGLGGVPGLPNPVYENSMPNPLVTWEKSDKYNLGLETVFSNGFDWDLDVFYEKRNSILITQSAVPRYMFGQLALPPTNTGIMSNRGFETSLGYEKKFSRDFRFSTRISAAFARNKVENLNETPYDDSFAFPYRDEGFPRNSVFGFDCLGYFKNQQEIDGWADQTGLGAAVLPGDLKYVDQNGDGVIDEKDKIRMNYPTIPELNLSMNIGVNYKGFDASILLQGVTNYTFDFSGRAIYDWAGNATGNYKNYFELHKYAWTPDKAESGGDIRYPRMHIDGASVSKQPSNYWLLDLWYMRIKNVEVGYTLPKSFLARMGFDNVRIYVSGLNLLTIDNMPFKYLDPEVSNSLSHPVFANYNIGLNITF